MSPPRVIPASRALVALAVLVGTLVGTLLPMLLLPPSSRAATDSSATPLTVRLTQLSPAAIPKKGKIVLAGWVRNDSQENWSAINVHPFVSHDPMTTRDELAAAALSDPATEVGPRITTPGLFVSIGNLAPGQLARFRIKIPVAELPISGRPGVYWIGVHALGANAQGSDNLADGRARTFMPLVSGTSHTSVALVVPIRDRVRRDPETRLLDTSDWATDLGPDGRLQRLLGFLAGAGSLPVSMLVDPAVVEAVQSIAADNPPLSLGTSTTPAQGPSSTPTDQVSRTINRLDATDRSNATSWLSAFSALASGGNVLGLGYADPDTAALARRRPSQLLLASQLSAETFHRLGITAVPTVAPPDGWLDDETLGRLASGTLVLVSDHSAPLTRTQWRTADGLDLVFTDEQASSGGPDPTGRLDALALRQRIVSDAALRAAEGDVSPMVVELPSNWDPGPSWQSAQFFTSLAQPWLDLVGVQTNDPGTPDFDAALGYPSSERRLEIGKANLEAAGTLKLTASVMGQLLRTTNDVEHVLGGTALTAVSYQARKDRGVARDEVLATDREMRNKLAGVEVTGTDFVTLSGSTGTVAVSLVNRLDQPITVGIRSSTSSGGVQIETPKPLQLAPGARTVLRLKASASSIGVHRVTLTPVTKDGAELGTPLTFSLRTSQVGTLIWIVLIAGGALLVVMIGRRILRGLRQHRWRGQ